MHSTQLASVLTDVIYTMQDADMTLTMCCLALVARVAMPHMELESQVQLFEEDEWYRAAQACWDALLCCQGQTCNCKDLPAAMSIRAWC